MSGTAVPMSDYALAPSSGNVTIPIGSTSAPVVLSAAQTIPAGINLTATMTLQSGAGYKVPTSGKSATITIASPAPTPVPTPAPSPSPQTHVWIAVRSDGLAGVGTEADPYDGGTAQKFDALMDRLQWTANLSVHLVGAGPFLSDARHNWTLRSGCTFAGEGMDVTTIKMVGSLAGLPGGASLVRSDPNYTTDNVTVRDLTVDCNWPELSVTADDGANGEKNTKSGAVFICGSNNLIQRVRSINSYGSWANLKEQFTIMLMASRNGDGTNNIIDSCRSEVPWGTNGNPFALAGWIDNVPGFLITNSKVINCTAVGLNNGANSGFTSGGVNLANVKDCTIDNNTFIDCNGAAYIDTGSVDGLSVTNNHVIRGWQGVGISCSTTPKQNIYIAGNDFNIQNRYSNGASYGVVAGFGTTTSVTVDRNTFSFDATGNGQREFLAVAADGVAGATISNNVVGTASCPVYNRVTGSGVTLSNNHAPDGAPVPGL